MEKSAKKKQRKGFLKEASKNISPETEFTEVPWGQYFSRNTEREHTEKSGKIVEVVNIESSDDEENMESTPTPTQSSEGDEDAAVAEVDKDESSNEEENNSDIIASDVEEESEDDEELNKLSNSDVEENESDEPELLNRNNRGDSPGPSRDFFNDEMEVESDSSNEKVAYVVPATPTLYMNNLQKGVFCRKMDCNSIFISIVPGESLYFSGKCWINVIKGVVEIYGCQLTSEEPKRVVFSPKGPSSLLCITSLASESEMDRDMAATHNSDIPNCDTTDLDAAMIVMELFENEWCEGIRNYCDDGESLIGPSATGMGPGKIPKLNELRNKLGFHLVSPCNYDKYRLFSTSPLWDEVLYSLQLSDNVPRLAVFGGKGVGKSTFFRWTVNKCLSLYGQSVLCVDLDPGQTEFTPPGMVSVYLCQEPLLGPNFTHLVQPLKAVFVGSVNISDCPGSYKRAVQSLYQFAESNEEFSKIPWIINTMGFSVGLGVDLACDVIKNFQPTAVVQITIQNKQRSFPFSLTYANVMKYQNKRSARRSSSSEVPTSSFNEYQFFNIESVCNAKNERNQNPWGGRPKSLRENTIVSYFAQLIGSTPDCNFLSIAPYQVMLKDTSIAIGTMGSDLSYENILRALNGNLVALCYFPQSSFSSKSTTGEPSTRSYILNGSSFGNSCFGYGVVRGIDLENELLFVITPIPQEILLEKVNSVILAGAIGLPIKFYTNGAENPSSLPYIAASKTKLDTAAKKHFNYKRTVPNVLKKSLR